MYFPLENSCLDSLSQCICSSLKGGTNRSPRHPAAQPAVPGLGQHCRQAASKGNATPGYAFLLLPHLINRSAE